MFESLFQTFAEESAPEQSAERIAALRVGLRGAHLDGFLVPRADRHQNEYVSPSEERLAWLTGFTGSAGIAIVLADKTALFVDGRYTLAVRDQIDMNVVTPVALAEASPEAWLARNVPAGGRIGYDPWLHTPGQIARLSKALSGLGLKASLVAVSPNPIDTIWGDRPAPPDGAISLHGRHLAGESAEKKLARIVTALGSRDALVVSDPHAVAWAFNIRGGDVAHTPIPLAFAMIPAKGKPRLYIASSKVGQRARDALETLADIVDPEQLVDDIETRGREGRSVLFDAATVPAKLTQAFEAAGGTAELSVDPIALMKARKNAVELKGARQAQLRDAAAMVRFLAWFEIAVATGRLTEIIAAQALESFRRETKKLKDVSFPTISAAGSNAAIPHYRVTVKTNRRIGKGIFLVDSGGQYADGTTDITRTIAVGTPTPAMRDRFTRVLKGHIAIARTVFPKGTNGAQIDAFARQSLWQAGLDFDHGTGHGVGSYLSVHEGPQRISKLGSTSLEPGMILSNEPGYYKPGQWGIRIENLVVVEPRKIAGAEREMLGFETLTHVPIDRALIEPKLLDAGEITWLNAYHARTRKELSPRVEPRVKKWLTHATRAIGR